MRTILTVAISLSLACAGSEPPVGVAPPIDGVPHLEERALLLLLADQQLYDPFTVGRVKDLGPEMRIELARALGRCGDPHARLELEAMLIDDDAQVRREAAFALGVLGDGLAIPVLGATAAGPDQELGRLSVEALAKLGAPVTRVVDSLSGLPQGEQWGRLAPSLYRFPAEEALPTVRRALIEGGTATYFDAMYALARNPLPASLPILRDLSADPDPRLRALAARALGRVGEGADLELLGRLLSDEFSGPVIHALRAGDALVSAGKAAPPTEWADSLLALMADPRVGVRLTAIEVAGAWQRDELLGAALLDRYLAGEGRERELALLALARSRHPRALELVGNAAASEDVVLRRRAASAAGLLESSGELERLVEDAASAVRAVAYAELLELEGETTPAWALLALEDPDPVVRAGAFDWLGGHPVVGIAELVAALVGMGDTDIVEAQLSAIGALVGRSAVDAEERELAVAALLLMAREADFVLRRRASEALGELGEPMPGGGTAESARTVAVYRDLLLRSWLAHTVRLTTSRGEIDIRLECRSAPLTCVNFVQLVGAGFYDGLPLHRVVPDFVIQGGDPRGDGYGGPGYAIRDEINHLRYERGRVGMALAGAHTGGSQFFITLAPQPHLDGGYTIFGSVVAGDEILDHIVQGDRILSARELTAPGG